jgi:hypothetical protein
LGSKATPQLTLCTLIIEKYFTKKAKLELKNGKGKAHSAVIKKQANPFEK